MNAEGRLALPGEGSGGLSLRPSRALTGMAIGIGWLLLKSSLLPVLGLSEVPFDPLLPLLVAYGLSSSRLEAVGLALALGVAADALSGVGASRSLLQYLLVVLVASPAAGHIVLRDRWMPTFGVVVLSLVSGLAAYLLLGLFGLELATDLSALPMETLAAALASLLLWPALVGLTGPQGSVGGGRSL